MQRITPRQRYFVLASLLYLVLGTIIIVRAAIGQSPVIVIFGVILVALGAIRLRDFRAWRSRSE
jgi:hypothetical protein